MKTHLPLLLAFATFAVPLSAHAATYTVNTTADTAATVADMTTSGTLRQMILNANASVDDDTIVFAPGVNGTIALTAANGGTLAVNSATSGSLSITGPVATTSDLGIAISGSNAVRVIQNFGDLTLTNLTIRDGNVATGNGAGILNLDSTRVINLTIDKCTFTNNKATASGAGAGGAIAIGFTSATTGSLTITNSTLSNNSAAFRGGAIANIRSTAIIQNCTITGNTSASGGGVSTSNTGGKTTVGNSIIVGNSPDDARVTSGSGVFVSQGYNLIGSSLSAASFDQTGDKTDVTVAQVKLGALADNGGPTQTHALLPGSVAINAGATTLPTDQRGAQRDATPDIGAFEFVNTPPTLDKGVFSASVNQAFTYPIVGKDANDGDTLTYAKTGTDVLPGTVTVASDGTVSGTPDATGTFNFDVTVTDSSGATATARFSLVVVNKPDGVAPRLTHRAIPSPLTRDQLAAITFSGTVKDLAPTDVTPSGVKRVQIQLRNSAGQAYNGTAFTPNLSPYYGTNLDPGGAADGRGYSRSLSFVPSSSVLTAGDYSLVVYGLDNAGNYGGLMIPFTIINPPAGVMNSAPSVLRTAPQASTSGGRS